MAVIPTVQIGDPVIRSTSQEVDRIGEKEQEVITNLTDSMRDDGLVGMAAPQIGEDVRIFVSEIRETKHRKDIKELDELRVFVNPKIIELSKELILGEEGCGSVAHAGLFGSVPRAQSLSIEALNEKGEAFTLEAEGFLARIIQHEVDHLDGKVFLDRMKDLKSLNSRE